MDGPPFEVLPSSVSLSERHFLGAICFMTFKKPEQMNLTDSPDQEAWGFGGF
jgi:hypothetical protein